MKIILWHRPFRCWGTISILGRKAFFWDNFFFFTLLIHDNHFLDWSKDENKTFFGKFCFTTSRFPILSFSCKGSSVKLSIRRNKGETQIMNWIQFEKVGPRRAILLLPLSAQRPLKPWGLHVKGQTWSLSLSSETDFKSFVHFWMEKNFDH